MNLFKIFSRKEISISKIKKIANDLKEGGSTSTTKLKKLGLSRYELKLLQDIQENDIDFNMIAKIIETRNPIFFLICLYENTVIDSYDKSEIIQAFQTCRNIDANTYLEIVRFLIRDFKDLESDDVVSLLCSLGGYKELVEPNIEKKIGMVSNYELEALAFITDKKDTLTDFQKERLMLQFTNIELIDFCISLEAFLTPDTKEKIILNTKNREYILKCIENKDLYLGKEGKKNLIRALGDSDEIMRKYISSPEVLNMYEIYKLLLVCKDIQYVKQCISGESIDLSNTCKAMLIVKKIKDIKFLESLGLELDLKNKDYVINAMGSEEQKQEWNDRIVQINDISEITIEKLETLPANAIIKMSDEKTDFYSIEEFIKIRKELDKILEGIETPIPGDEATELKAFLEVVKRLAMHMSYDHYANSKEGKKDEKLQRECRSLYGGLVNGECVCAGYAIILKNALACLGIEAKYISGVGKFEFDGHAWNQVKIGGKWYNVDLTIVRDEIVRTGVVSKEILKSDKEFEDHKEFCEERTKHEEICVHSMATKTDCTDGELDEV